MRRPAPIDTWVILLLLGLPAVLIRVAGSPVPSTAPTRAQVERWMDEPFAELAPTAVAVWAGWLLWLLLATVAIVEVYRWVRRRRRMPRLELPQPAQLLTATLVGTATVTATQTGAAAADTGGPATTADTTPQASTSTTTGAARAVTAPRGPANIHVGATGFQHIVERGDTLSMISQQWLGTPSRWPEICTLNRHRHFPKIGGTLRDCDLIYPGWDLRLPADAKAPPGVTPIPSPPPRADRPATPAPNPPHDPDDTEAAPPAPPGARPGDDGVADTPSSATEQPQADTLPRKDAPTPRTPRSPAPTDSSRDDQRTAAPGLSLPSGGWIDLGLAAAITAAAALAWRLRRRRYTPRPPSVQPRGSSDPDLTPLSQVVAQVRRGLRTPPDDDTNAQDRLDSTSTTTDTDVEPVDHTDQQVEARAQLPLRMPALGNPMLATWPPAGLGLTGAGSEAAARGFLAAALAAGGADDPHGRGSVVLPAATLATLLGAPAVNVPDTPRLTVTGDLSEALELLEEQTLHRARLVSGHEVDTVAQVREADPYEEPLPPILLIADATVPHKRARIAALLAQGQRLDIHGVLLGQWPDGNTVVVAGDGATTPSEGEGSRHGSHPADVGRLAVLTAAEVAALLPVLAESHTGLPQPPAPAEPQRSTATAIAAPATTVPTGTHPPAEDKPDAARTGDPAEVSKTPSASTAPSADAAESDTSVGADNDHTAVPAHPQQPVEDGQDVDDDGTVDGPGVVAVQVLGKPVIVGADPKLRAKAMELLVYLIARDGGATTDAIVEDLVPDALVSRAPGRIHTYVYALREALKRAGGRATYITHPPHRYVLNRDAFDVDLWRMRGFLAEAETADGQARVTALRQAVDAYRGPFADGAFYEWAEPYREAIRCQALDAHLALADALRDQPEQALTVLDAAIAHNPDAEPLYQAAMRLHADLDDVDAIAARLTQLTRRLEELDTEPTDETRELAGTLTDDIRRRARRGPSAAA